MFKRSNFVAKYKQYAKSLKSLKAKNDPECVSTLGQNYLKFTESIKNVLSSNTKSINRHKEVLSIIHNKVVDKIEKSKENCVNWSQTLRNNRFAKASAFSASVGIFKTDPVTISESPGTEATTTFGDGINAVLTTNYAASTPHVENNINTFGTSAESSIVVEAIPEPPSLPDVAADAASQINALGESTFAALGLGGYTPVGIVQHCFEYLHVTLGIPWWEAIAIGTLVIRFAMFPLVIMSQKNAARMNNHLPQMQVIQMKMTEARQCGNQMEVARYSQELMMFMKDKQLNPFKNMIVPMAQMPIFVSFFMGLREMANVPVDSLRTGGMFWFTDLTVPDQFFALPIITSLTLWATIELGTDSARLNSQNLQTMKYVLRALPFVILPFTVNFPGAILCYWVSSNFISLGQVGFLKIPAVRDYFKIDPMLKHDPTKLPIKNKGFVGGLKDSWTNMKITKELEERRRLDEMQFQRAGKGPLVKTYKYDPTKQVKQVVKVKSVIKNS